MKKVVATLIAFILAFVQAVPVGAGTAALAIADDGNSGSALVAMQGSELSPMAIEGSSLGVCRVGSKYYSSIQAAYDAIPLRGTATIEVLSDCGLASTVAFNRNVTVTVKSADSANPVTVSRSAGLNKANRLFTVSLGTVSFQDIVIDGARTSAGVNGALVGVTAGVLNLNSGTTLQNGVSTKDGGGAAYISGGALNMNDGATITKCEATATVGYNGLGGGVLVAGGEFTMNGGTISECAAYRDSHFAGGGVCHSAGKFTMNGGTITKCSAPNSAGGGVGINHGMDMYMNGGTITECWSTDRGSAVEVHGDLYISGNSTITGNYTVEKNGGAVNFWNNARHLYVADSIRIIGNHMANGAECNVDVYNHQSGSSETLGCIVIQEGKKINADAVIGVTTNTKQAKEDGQFGEYRNGAILDNLSAFVNDVNPDVHGADGGNNKLIWSKGLKLVGKMYVKDTQKAVEISTSKGVYGFTYPAGLGRVYTTKTIGEIEAAHALKYGYKNYIDYDSVFMYGIADGDSEHAAKVKSTLDRNSKKCSNEYSLVSWPNRFLPLDFNTYISLYYQIKPAVTVSVKDYNSKNAAVQGARFELYSGSTKLWSGTSDANGKLTIPWRQDEWADCGGATFEAGSAYELVQLETDAAHVRPAGSWTISMSDEFKLSMQANASAAGENRTIDAQQTAPGAFTVYNDSKPRVIFDANGGSVNGAAEYTVEFSTTDTAKSFTVPDVKVTKPANMFAGWTTGKDGSGTPYSRGDEISFARVSDNDDVTLYAQWEQTALPVQIKTYEVGDFETQHDYAFERTLTGPLNSAPCIKDASSSHRAIVGTEVDEALIAQGYVFGMGSIAGRDHVDTLFFDEGYYTVVGSDEHFTINKGDVLTMYYCTTPTPVKVTWMLKAADGTLTPMDVSQIEYWAGQGSLTDANPKTYNVGYAYPTYLSRVQGSPVWTPDNLRWHWSEGGDYSEYDRVGFGIGADNATKMSDLKLFDEDKLGMVTTVDGMKYGILDANNNFINPKIAKDNYSLYVIYGAPSVNLAVTASADNANGHRYTVKVESSADGGQTYETVAEDVALEIPAGSTSGLANVQVPLNCKVKVTLNAGDYPVSIECRAGGTVQYGSTATLDVGSAATQVDYSLRYALPSPTGFSMDLGPFVWILALGGAFCLFELLIRRKNRA